MQEKIRLDSKQIEVIEKLFDLATHSELDCIAKEGIRRILRDAKSLTFQSVYIKEATKEDVEKSKLLSDEFRKSNKCIITVTSNENATLSDLDTIMNTISAFHKCEYTFTTIYDENQRGFQIDTFLI